MPVELIFFQLNGAKTAGFLLGEDGGKFVAAKLQKQQQQKNNNNNLIPQTWSGK